MMEAIVLAGGLGTRLRPVVPGVPKPMAPVGGRPFLEILLNELVRQGFGRVVLSLGHLAEQVVEHFGTRYGGASLVHEIEETPLGTGGALRRALTRCLGDHVYVFNGDTYLELSVTQMEVRWRRDRVPLVVGHAVEESSRYGLIETVRGRITGFREKGAAGPGVINAGCYLLPTDLVDELPSAGPFSFERDYLAHAVVHRRFDLHLAIGRFIDIGVPESYANAQTEFAT